jgi:ParB family chromosome partitioning protein
LRLPEDIQRLLEEEKLSTGHARALLGIDDQDIQRKVAKDIIDHSLSVRETERAIRRIIAGASPTVAVLPAIKRQDANMRSAETKLRRQLGTQVRLIPSQKGPGGKIEIEFYNDNDLDRLYQLLMGKHEVASA